MYGKMELIWLRKGVYSGFPKEEVYGLTSQIRRSAIPIPSNSVEGSARNSTKEFVQFHYVALGYILELGTPSTYNIKRFKLPKRLEYI
jgi:four helix bundle protein